MLLRICLFVLLTLFRVGTECAYALSVNQTMPNCSVNSMQGNNLTTELSHYKGQPLYVDFWASWCSPCVQSFPFLNSLHQTFNTRGLQIIAINVDEKKPDAEAFLRKYPANFTVVADPQGQCPRQFGVMAMPSSYLIDSKGIVRHIHLGFRPGDANQLQALVEQLVTETNLNTISTKDTQQEHRHE